MLCWPCQVVETASQNRRQKVVNRVSGALRFCGGLDVCAKGAWHSNLTKIPLIYNVSYFHLGVVKLCLGGDNPTSKSPPWWRDCRNLRDRGGTVSVSASASNTLKPKRRPSRTRFVTRKFIGFAKIFLNVSKNVHSRFAASISSNFNFFSEVFFFFFAED